MSKLFVLAAIFITQVVQAEIHTETIEYKAGDKILQGYVAYDAKLAAKRPGVLIVHDWMGMSPFVKKKAEELALMGYTAFAADIYGKDVRPKDSKEAGEVAGLYKTNRPLLRERVMAGYQELRTHKTVDKSKIAAIGFCFGGMTALELARAGAELKGVVSFHGNLDTPSPTDAKNIKGRLLILHGADDPYVPPAQVAAFEKEMKDAKISYQIEKFPGAVHAFTNPDAGTDNTKGAAYNAQADEKSQLSMRQFFNQVFKKKL